jgi:hypothetical protein
LTVLGESNSSSLGESGVNFPNIFGPKSRAVFARIIFNAFYGNTIWQKNAPKYDAQRKICRLKYPVKFWQKCW